MQKEHDMRKRLGGRGNSSESRIFGPKVKWVKTNRKTRRRRAKQTRIKHTKKLVVVASQSTKRSIEDGGHLGALKLFLGAEPR